MREKIERLLLAIVNDLQHLNDPSYIIGSCALFLSGIPIEKVSDIDLLVSSKDADFLKRNWANRMQNYSPDGAHLFRSNFGRYRFEEFDVEVMGNLQVCKGGQWISLRVNEFNTIAIGSHSIRIPTLKEQHRIFTFFGREKDLWKARLIEDFTISPSISKK